jgi:hypothetical protein
MVEPFFSPQQRRIAVFLRTINRGTGTAPPSLVPLGGRKPRRSKSADDGIPPWACPAVSPRSAGLACPVSLYGAKTIPPTRAERGEEPAIRRRRHAAGSGPNYRRSRQRIRRRNPPPATPMQALFTWPRCLRRLSDWAFLNPNHALPMTDSDDDKDDHIFVSEVSHEPRDDVDIASPTDQTRDKQCPDWIDNSDDNSTMSRHSCSHPIAPPRTQPQLVFKHRATMSESSNENEQTYVISKILTQNAHGRQARDGDGNLRPNSPPDYT